MSILEIRDLEVVYRGRDGMPVRAVVLHDPAKPTVGVAERTSLGATV